MVVGLLVLVAWRGIADVFTAMQQQDKHFAHPDAGLFQKINTVLFGVSLVGFGIYDLFR